METRVEQLRRRSQELADTTRRMAVTLNAGGIGVAFSLAGAMQQGGVIPLWTLKPVPWFVAGLVCICISLFFAKHRELRRLAAARKEQEEPRYDRWPDVWKWSFTWDALAFVAFAIGSYRGYCAALSLAG